MRAEAIPIRDLTQRDIDAWRVLAANALEPNPFFEPNFILPLASGLDHKRDVQLLAVRNRDQWQACVPFRLSRWRRIPLPAAVTWRPSHSLLGTPLVLPDDPEQSLDALLTGLLAQPLRSYALLEWIAEDGAVARALNETLQRRSLRSLPVERFERAVVRREGSERHLERGMSKRSRRRLARKRTALEEELGEPVTISDRAGEPGAYEEFLALEASGWKGRSGTALARDSGASRFFQAMCKAFDAEGRLEILALGGEQMIAAQCNLIAHDVLFNLKIAYDESWARFSPGIQLDVEVLTTLHERTDIRKIDSCASPNNEAINRLWPDRKRIATVALPARGPAGAPVRPLLAAASALRRRRE